MPPIIFENNDFLVVNKPVNLVVNTSSTSAYSTLQEYIKKYLSNSTFEQPDELGEFTSRNGIVHRLDKPTSGIILVAKTPEVFYELKSQFMTKSVEKTYIALLEGSLKDETVIVDAPIGRDPKNRLKNAIVKDGKPAQTTFKRLNVVTKNDFTASLSYVYPSTGRMHQIRLHALAINHPVLGDQKYCSKSSLIKSMEALEIDRLMLHALAIEFNLKGEKYKFKAPLPETFSKYM